MEKMIEAQYRVVMSKQVRTIERLERKLHEAKERIAQLEAGIAEHRDIDPIVAAKNLTDVDRSLWALLED
jgi:predicted RNase H-like nuclease (RuvC/YqgF family)